MLEAQYKNDFFLTEVSLCDAPFTVPRKIAYSVRVIIKEY